MQISGVSTVLQWRARNLHIFYIRLVVLYQKSRSRVGQYQTQKQRIVEVLNVAGTNAELISDVYSIEGVVISGGGSRNPILKLPVQCLLKGNGVARWNNLSFHLGHTNRP